MNPWLIPFTLPVLLQGWLLGLLSLTFGIAKSPRVKRGVMQLTWRDWIANRWRYSTTLGACMWIHPQHGGTTEFHEFLHVQQYEDEAMKAAWVLGIVAFWEWKLALILYAFSGPLWLITNFIGGLARYGNAYYGSSHERAAYCQTAIETARDGRPIGIE